MRFLSKRRYLRAQCLRGGGATWKYFLTAAAAAACCSAVWLSSLHPSFPGGYYRPLLDGDTQRQRWCFVRVMRFAVGCCQGVLGAVCCACAVDGWSGSTPQLALEPRRQKKVPNIQKLKCSLSQGETRSNMYKENLVKKCKQ